MPEETIQQESPVDVADDATRPEAAESEPAGQESDESADDAAIKALQAGGGRAGAIAAIANFGKSKPVEEPAPTPAGEAATSAAPGTTPGKESGQPSKPNLSADEVEIARRFHLDVKYLPTDPSERAEFIAHLKQRHDDGLNLYSEKQRLKQQLKQQAEQLQQLLSANKPNLAPAAPTALPAQQAAPILPAEDESYLKWLGETYSEEHAVKERDRLVRNLSQFDTRLSPVQQQLKEAQEAATQLNTTLATQGQMLHELHIEQGMEQIKKLLPDLSFDENTESGKANLAKLMEEAQTLLAARFDPRKFHLRHALTTAANSVFQNDIHLAQRKASAEAHKKAVRGGSTAGGTPSRTKPAPTEDEVDDLLLAEIAKGEHRPPLQELERMARGKG